MINFIDPFGGGIYPVYRLPTSEYSRRFNVITRLSFLRISSGAISYLWSVGSTPWSFLNWGYEFQIFLASVSRSDVSGATWSSPASEMEENVWGSWPPSNYIILNIHFPFNRKEFSPSGTLEYPQNLGRCVSWYATALCLSTSLTLIPISHLPCNGTPYSTENFFPSTIKWLKPYVPLFGILLFLKVMNFGSLTCTLLQPLDL